MSEEKKKMEKALFDTEEYKKMMNTKPAKMVSDVTPAPEPPEPLEPPTDNNPPESLKQRIEEDTTLTGTARAILEKTLKNPRVDTEDDS